MKPQAGGCFAASSRRGRFNLLAAGENPREEIALTGGSSYYRKLFSLTSQKGKGAWRIASRT
jgi:hypothetical protein